eukprot:Lithocolla_globosa_v1_NODE_3809_length_1574_cov_10.786043.p1 type:complete len:311 gc:universal NODE_3809_length_1574_cov_10.786043:310-1242(+)
MDIAGLVKGANEGEGLGNAFLSHVRATDCIIHMIRVFDSEEISHVEGDVNPIRDIEIIHEELRLKDEAFITQRKEELERKGITRGGIKERKAEYEAIMKLHEWVVNQKKEARTGDWSARDIEEINNFQLLTSMPMVYLINMSKGNFIKKKNKWLPKIKEWMDAHQVEGVAPAPVILFSAEYEQELALMSADEREAAEKASGCPSVLPKIITTVYKALQLMYYFTAGAPEVRAWTLRTQTKAPAAAGVIHSDFERGFIMAEVMHFADMQEYGSEAAVKGAGKYHSKGREYIMQDGDVVHFKFNVTSKPKGK